MIRLFTSFYNLVSLGDSGHAHNQTDLVKDFELGVDLFDFSALEEISSFADLAITTSGNFTHIDDLNSDFAIDLVGIIPLSESDFIFS